MTEVEAQAEKVRVLRAKFNATLEQIKPRLSAKRLVDETVREFIANPEFEVLAKASVAGAVASIFNTLVARKPDRHRTSHPSITPRKDTP